MSSITLRSHRDSHQQMDLHRLLRLQNQVIIGLSSCLALLVLSTVILIQHLPRQNDTHSRFWEETGDSLLPQQQKQSIVVKEKCASFGCPIRPVEMSQLTSHTPAIASSSHILLTHKNNRMDDNLDRGVLIPSFKYDNHDDSLQLTTIDPRDDFFMGVFDGHNINGDEIAQFASDEIPSRIASKMKEKFDAQSNNFNVIKDIIKETILEIDKDVPGSTGGGCTASIMLRIGKKLFMANIGDSTEFIVVYTPPRKFNKGVASDNDEYIKSERSARFEMDLELRLQGKITIYHQNIKHRPALKEERMRIESMGGRVYIPRERPEDSKLIRQKDGAYVGIGVSRSIGNHEWTSFGVTNDPDIVSLNLIKFWSENDIDVSGGKKVFVVLGSDGLFDARREEYVASHLAYGLFEDPNHLLEVGKKLIKMVVPVKKEWLQPDISVLAKVIEL